MNQRGLMQLSLMAWGAIGAGVIIIVLGAAVTAKSSRLDACKTEHAAFVKQIEALGKTAQAEADAVKERLAANLKKTETNYEKSKRDLAIVSQRLRAERARGNLVPPAAATTQRPELACYDRTELTGALERFRAGVAGIAETGDERTLDLNAAKEWAQGLGP